MLVFPYGLRGLDGNRLNGADLIGTGSDLIIVLDGIKRRRSIFDCRYHRTRILQRVIHRVGQRTVGTGLKILPPFTVGQMKRRSPTALKSVSGLVRTWPVAPSIPATTFCITVCLAHRNSPLYRSSV